jgi:hypothetical protein
MSRIKGSRNEEVLRLKESGFSNIAISRILSISRQRVSQVIKGIKSSKKPVFEEKIRSFFEDSSVTDGKIRNLPHFDQSEKSFSTHEAARFLSVHIGTIVKWQKKGMIQPTCDEDNGERRFSWQDIQRLLKNDAKEK